MIPLDVAPLLTEFNVGPLTVERRGVPVQNEWGGYDAAPVFTFQLNPVAAHNVVGRDLLQVSEADRNSEVVQFYTRVRLFVSDGGQAADVILYRGRRFRITKVQDFDLQGLVYCAFGTLEDVQAVP